MVVYLGQWKNEQYGCHGIMVCPCCGKARACWRESENQVVHSEQIEQEGEQNDMIPRGNNSNQSTKGGKKKASGFRFISADMLSSTHQLATIQDARIQPDNFNPNAPEVLVVKLKFKGEFILWTLRANNPNLEELGDSFGDDESKWSGKEIELFVEEDNFSGKKWIRAEAVTEGSKSKRAK
jgi:hypothetical protein